MSEAKQYQGRLPNGSCVAVGVAKGRIAAVEAVEDANLQIGRASCRERV